MATPESLNKSNFKAHPENINRKGRPKKVFNQMTEMIDSTYKIQITKAQKIQVIERLLEMPVNELTKLSTLSETPAFILCISNAILKDIKAGRINTVETIFDRIFGRPHQSTEIAMTPLKPLTFSDFMRQGRDPRIKERDPRIKYED